MVYILISTSNYVLNLRYRPHYDNMKIHITHHKIIRPLQNKKFDY